MYKDGFVISIMRDGRPLRESGRTVRMPFDSEYKIRLKNKHGKSCKARVTIDGTPVSQLGDFVISSWGTLDLERFVNDSLNKGKKFKFISAKSGEVQDPTNSDNGLIRVEFYLAKNGPIVITRDGWGYPPYFPERDSEIWPCNGDSTDDYGKKRKRKRGARLDGDTYQQAGSPVNSFYCSTNVSFTNNVTDTIPDDKGATVEGGDSNQSFMTVSDFETEIAPVVLELELRAPRDGVAPEPRRNYCGSCGARRRGRDKYCPQCGRRF